MEAICTTDPGAIEPSWFSQAWNLQYMAHGHCYRWRSEILWPQVISDLLIAISYYSIPCILVWFLRKRRDVPFHRIFLVFAIFILACGTTHLIEVVSVWEPMYRLQAVMKVITAAVSVTAVVMLIPVIPQALALPSLAQTNAKLSAVANELRRSNQDLTQFAYLAAHDLQEPMRMVTLNLDMLERKLARKADQSEIDKHLAFAREGADRMHARLDGLLAYGVLDELPTGSMPIPVRPELDAVLAELANVITAKKVVIAIEDPGEIPVPAEQIRIVLRHLLGNALKFHDQAGPPPRIVVSGTRTATERTIRVTDNGIGIEAVHVERVQQMFQRLHVRERFPGLGVGLAIAKKIAVRNGGRLDIASTPGTGTTVTLIFPV